MKIIGITGGIACGKSFVTGLFGAWGARIGSADADARAAVAPGSATLDAVFEAFPGVQAEDGSLDRARLAERIFAEADARARLESILHPEVYRRMQEAIANAASDASISIFAYEIPLLFEKDRQSHFDVTVAVVCSAENQAARLQARERLASRPPLNDAQIAERLSAQLPNEEKARRADYVIRTDGTISETEVAAADVWKLLVP